MLTAILLQLASVAILAPGAWIFIDATSAYYLVLGAMAAIIPNALFALRLTLNRGKSPESYPVVFFLGEFLKLGLTLGLLMAAIRYGGGSGNGQEEPVRWLALLIGLIVALKMPLFALALHREKDLDALTAIDALPGLKDTGKNTNNDAMPVTLNPPAMSARKVPVRLSPYHPADARNT